MVSSGCSQRIHHLAPIARRPDRVVGIERPAVLTRASVDTSALCQTPELTPLQDPHSVPPDPRDAMLCWGEEHHPLPPRALFADRRVSYNEGVVGAGGVLTVRERTGDSIADRLVLLRTLHFHELAAEK